MTEIGRLLLLPPPSASSPNSGGRVVATRPGAGRSNGDSGDDVSLTRRVEEAADATSGTRGKQFRFRVLDGGRNDALAGNAEVPARTDPKADQKSGDVRDQAAIAAGGKSPGLGGSVPMGTPLATFLAQLIAQEQLRPGLYDPPVKAADRAYRQAGAEPALDDHAPATARFRLAV